MVTGKLDRLPYTKLTLDHINAVY